MKGRVEKFLYEIGTAAVTEEIGNVEKEIDERVKGLYGL